MKFDHMIHMCPFVHSLTKKLEEIQNKKPPYRLGTVNSRSFISKDFLQIKWKYELNYAL